jgi:hypothetical protein
MRTFSGEYGRLEDLLRFDERYSTIDETQANRWAWRALAVTFGLSVVIWAIAHVIGYAPPFLLILFVCAGGVSLRLILLTVSEPRWRQVGELVRAVSAPPRIAMGGWYEGGDGMTKAIRRWDRRLEWGATYPQRYAFTVAPRLAEVVDEWLRQQYGLTAANDQARARALLGEPMWAILHPEPGRAPTAKQMAQALVRLE